MKLIIRNFIISISIFIFLSGCLPDTTINENLPVSTSISNNNIEILDNPGIQKIQNKEYLSISQVQGKSHISPYNRKSIKDLFGVVTFKRADGFYIQSIIEDIDTGTSEGIYIYTNLPPKVEVGDWVLIDGQVVEYYPGGLETGNLSTTQIEKPVITVLSRGNETPSPVIIGNNGRVPPNEIIDDDNNKSFDMEDGLDFYESLESMLVQINNAVCISSSSAYKEFAVLADNGSNSSGRNIRGGLTVNSKDYNPERLIIDDSFASVPIVSLGDYFEDPIIGIMDYTFGNYKIQPIKKIRATINSVNEEIANKRDDSLFAIASINVENMDPNDSSDRFKRLAEIIVDNMLSPEVIAVQEIQDNNGPINNGETEANLTYQLIIEAIKSLGGPQYKFIDISPINNKDGGEPGGNIRVGFLYIDDMNLNLVQAQIGEPDEDVKIIGKDEEIRLNINPGRIDPRNFAFVDSRKPLVAEFLYNKTKIFIINNHWNSKGGDTPLFGSSQPPRQLSENQRKSQARVVSEFITTLLIANPKSNIVILGDLNDFYFSKSVETIETSGMINLLKELPESERYTYNYEGNAQNLDNFLVSPSLFEFVHEIDIIHINSEFSYRTRFSDHDPILVSFELP